MSTATEPLTGDEKLTLRHAIESAIARASKAAAWQTASSSYHAARIKELRSAAAKLGLDINEANI